MFLAAPLFGGLLLLLLSLVSPCAALELSTVAGESHDMDGVFVKGIDSANGLRVLKKTWEDAAGGSLPFSEQAKEVSSRVPSGQEGEAPLAQGQAQ